MELFRENCGVIMTTDKKCVLRGKGSYNMCLCLVEEKSRYSIRKYRNVKNIEKYIDTRWIKVSDKVKELYNLDTNRYDKDKMGELVSVKLKVTYSD